MARARGFADWAPRADTLVVIGQVKSILSQYEEYGAMTCRQIFYRLVGQYDFDKTEKAYARLCEYLVRARRAQMIKFSAIRDDGTVSKLTGGVDSPEEWWGLLENEWQSFGRDRTHGQEVEIELWCEAGGMAPMLAGFANPYGVGVYSTGGFSSVTVTREIAMRAARRRRSTIFLHVGDYDPSGASIFESMAEDASTFFAQAAHWEGASDEVEFIPRRVALTAEQVDEFALPTAPAKESDSRSVTWEGETCQLEAMAPSDLKELVERTIEGIYDMEVYDTLLTQERSQRAEIRREWTEEIIGPRMERHDLDEEES